MGKRSKARRAAAEAAKAAAAARTQQVSAFEAAKKQGAELKGRKSAGSVFLAASTLHGIPMPQQMSAELVRCVRSSAFVMGPQSAAGSTDSYTERLAGLALEQIPALHKKSVKFVLSAVEAEAFRACHASADRRASSTKTISSRTRTTRWCCVRKKSPPITRTVAARMHARASTTGAHTGAPAPMAHRCACALPASIAASGIPSTKHTKSGHEPVL